MGLMDIVRNQVEDILSVVEGTRKARRRVSPKHDVDIKGRQEAKSGPFALSGFCGLGRVGCMVMTKTEGRCASLTDPNKGL